MQRLVNIKMLCEIVADDIPKKNFYFFLDKIKLGISCESSAWQMIFFFFSEKIKLGISCESSAWQMIYMKYQVLFSL